MNYFITLRKPDSHDADILHLIQVDPTRIVMMARSEFVTWLFFGGDLKAEPVVETPEEIDTLVNDMMIRRHYARLA